MPDFGRKTGMWNHEILVLGLLFMAPAVAGCHRHQSHEVRTLEQLESEVKAALERGDGNELYDLSYVENAPPALAKLFERTCGSCALKNATVVSLTVHAFGDEAPIVDLPGPYTAVVLTFSLPRTNWIVAETKFVVDGRVKARTLAFLIGKKDDAYWIIGLTIGPVIRF